MADVKGEPVVLADDILTAVESQAMAEIAAGRLRHEMQRQSRRRLQVTVRPYAEDGVVAKVTVLHQSAWIIDLGTQLRSRR